jgi:predicted amidohydrolase YtcJ
MDSRNTVARSVVIRGDRIAVVSTSRGIPKHDACATAIDLHGRTVVPGLIDSHNGRIDASAPSLTALGALKSLQTDADRRRGALETP